MAIPVISHDWDITLASALYNQTGLSGEELTDMFETAASDEEALTESRQEMVIRATITNTSLVAAPEGKLNILFGPVSNRPTIRAQRTLVGTVDLPALGPGQRTNAKFVWKISDLADDNVQLYLKVVPADETASTAFEVNQQNNEFNFLVTNEPDLQVSAVQRGSDLVIRVVNVGSAAAANVDVRVFALDENGRLGESIIVLQSPTVSGLNALGAYEGEVSITVALPTVTGDGQTIRDIVVIVDPDDAIRELNDSNNSSRLMIEAFEEVQ